MRLNEQEARMFESLRKGELGKQLAAYLERLEGDVCDVRNWTEKDSPESARQAARALQEFRSHLKPSIGTDKDPTDDYI